MRKLVNPAPPLQMTTVKPPPIILLTIEPVGDGTYTQSQDPSRGLWQPNRDPAAGGVSPLILRPKLEVTDNETGAKVTVTPTYTWYVDEEASSWDSTNERGRVAVLGGQSNDDKYYLETNNGTSTGTPTGRLVVRKNVDYLQPKKIILKVAFTYALHPEPFSEKAEVILSAQHLPDSFFAVRLQCPSTVHFNPFKDATSLRTFRAVATKGKETVSTLVKFFWTLNGVAIPTDNTLPAYQTGNQPSGKGQGTDTIVIDMDAVREGTLGVAIGETANAATPLDYAADRCTLAWDIPRLELLPYSRGSKFLKEDTDSRAMASLLHVDGGDADAARRAEYLRQQWWTKPSNTTVKTMHEWGEETVFPGSTLKKAGNVNVDVNADLYLLGPLEVLTDDNGVPLTDDSGSATASSYGGLVVGRD